jgi:hypothetical protein
MSSSRKKMGYADELIFFIVTLIARRIKKILRVGLSGSRRFAAIA